MPDDIIPTLQAMLDRFNRKRNLHQLASTSFKNQDMKVFTIPLMALQLTNAVLPQIAQLKPWLEDGISILTSSLAAVCAIWLGFQAKMRFAERSESHKNAASIYQHLAVLAMLEKRKANMMTDYDEFKFFTFHETAQNLEAKAKDDEYLVPLRIKKAYYREKHEKEMEKAAKNDGKEEGWSGDVKKMEEKLGARLPKNGTGYNEQLSLITTF